MATGCDVSWCRNGDLGGGDSAVGPNGCADDAPAPRLGARRPDPVGHRYQPARDRHRRRAALSGNIGVAVGNILGGIAIQTVVLVALDAFGVRGSRPLTYRAASLVLVLEAALVVAVLAIVIAGTQMPATLIAARLTPAPVLILIVWVLGLVLLRRAERSLPWHESGQPPDGQQQPRGHRTAMTEQQATAEGTSTTRAAVSFPSPPRSR